MNEIKQQQLTWEKGMTNVPSDLVCDDNTCESEVNMIYRDGEHRPIQDEQVMFEGASLLPVVFVHKYNNYKHYISLKTDNTITWYDEKGVLAPSDIANAPVLGDNVQVEAIGNTLIVNSSNGLGYYLWKPADGNYKYLGNKIPEPEVEFMFINDSDRWVYMSDAVSLEGTIDRKDDKPFYIGAGKQTKYNDAVVGVYASNKNGIARKGGFCNPFFIRYAVEMYDGSYTNISIPILMIPVVGHNSYWMAGTSYSDDNYYLYTYYARIIYRQKTDYSEWLDLVSHISLFVSKGVDVYDTQADQTIGETASYSKNFTIVHCIRKDDTLDNLSNNAVDTWGMEMKYTISSLTGERVYDNCLVDALSEFANVIDELKEDNVFYKIKELPTSVNEKWELLTPTNNALLTLTSQQRLGDDYYSNCEKGGEGIFCVNNRIHIIKPYRKNWEGASHFIGCEYPLGLVKYNFIFDLFVYIRTKDGIDVVHREVKGYEMFFRTYFFYPNPKAFYAALVIYKNKGDNSLLIKNPDINYTITGMTLTESPSLNGAWWFGEMPRTDMTLANLAKDFTEPGIPQITNLTISYENQIWTSEVNNPWVFTAKGNNTIGSGEILGLASQTTALSQGQFGQYPLIAFCSDGIWALQTDNEGLYSAVHPMSREICNNPKSITETDGYVFFTTEKGLMVVDGGQVRCVSEQLSGKMADSTDPVVYNGALAEAAPLWLKDYLKSCYIAYDYRDSLLWIFIPNRMIAFVYSMKDGTFGMKAIPNIQRAINDYPDTLLQDKDGKVYSLLNRNDINNDSNGYDCELISRPMKLENSTALKTLTRIKLIYEQAKSTKAEVRVFASNDCKNWLRVLSLHGRGFKYWKFAIRFREMSAVDTFSGALINTQERYTYRMR